MTKSPVLISRRRTVRAGAATAALLSIFGGSCTESHTYVINISVKGSLPAVQGRRIRAGTTDMPTFDPTGETFIALCTPSADKFFKAVVPMVVSDENGVVSATTLTPIACRFAEPRGSVESVDVFLMDDGTLLTDFAAGDARVRAHCASYAAGPTCPRGDEL